MRSNWLFVKSLLLIALLVCGDITAQAADTTMETLQQQLSQLDNNDDSTETKTLRDLYEQSQKTLKSLNKTRDRISDLNQEIKDQPRQLELMRRQINSPLPAQRMPNVERTRLSKLEQLITVRKADLVKKQQQRDTLSQQIENNDSRLMSLREQLANLRQDDEDYTPIKGESSQVQAARAQLEDLQKRLHSSQAQLIELQLLALPGENELNQLQLKRLRREIDQLKQYLDSLQDKVRDRRRTEIENTLSELKTDEGENLPPVLADAQKQNVEFSDELRDLLKRIDQGNAKYDQLNDQLTRINQNYRMIQQQLEVQERQVSGNLRYFTRELTRPISTKEIRSQINEQRLRSLELDREEMQLRDELNNQSYPDELNDKEKTGYVQLMHDRLNLMSGLRKNRQQLINQLSEILSVQELINDRLRQARELVDKRLLWMPTVAPLNLDWFNDLAQAIGETHNLVVKLSESGSPLRTFPQVLIIGTAFLLGVLSFITTRYERMYREQWRKFIGNVTRDRFSHSLMLLVNGILRALPLSALFWLTARFGLNSEHIAYDGLQTLCTVLAAICLVHICVRTWLRPETGLAIAHLGLPKKLLLDLRHHLALLVYTGTPLLTIIILSENFEQGHLISTFGRLAFFGLTLILLRIWYQLWQQDSEVIHVSKNWWSNAKLWTGLMMAINAVLLLMGIAGYIITAMFVMMILALMICLISGVFLLYWMGVRYLLIVERRFAFNQAKARRAEQVAARENHEEEPLKEDYIDLQTISDQARLLLKVACLLLLALLTWLMLGQYLPTLNILEGVQLWTVTQTDPSGESLRAITLSDVLVGVMTLGFSLLAAYNLPGVLELLVLRHMHLTPGSNYAVTTLLKYILILIGVISGIAQFGVEWDKLQWLVAALGVGLGFGLQEIVANFISGLIILFEKPFRIGDTVTIGTLTGNVSRIQIRATTLIDFDNKEVIIPNKTFITERLINWSLSDSTTRIVLQIGVAYGSDTQLVRDLLEQSASEQEKVLKEPAPYAYFREFGDSTLNFNLHFYVSQLSDRLPTTHAVNLTIDQLFREHDIEIAFPQMDIHLRKDEEDAPKQRRPIRKDDDSHMPDQDTLPGADGDR